MSPGCLQYKGICAFRSNNHQIINTHLEFIIIMFVINKFIYG
jgi:hypothetical protein